MTLPTGIYNALDFGVVGNGTTNDAPAIQAMLDAALPGSRYYFPAGPYLINSPIVISKDNIWLIGADGAGNPQGDGVTAWVTSVDLNAPVLTWDKVPGGTAQPAPAPDNVMDGGGLRGIHLNLTLKANTHGIKVVSARNMIFQQFTVMQIGASGRGIWTTNHGSAPGAADIWDHNTRNVFRDFQLSTSTGTCMYLANNTYGCTFTDFGCGPTGAGIGIDLYTTDDLWFENFNLQAPLGGTALRMTGTDYSPNTGGGLAIEFVKGFIGGAGTHVRLINDGYDVAPNLLLLAAGVVDTGDLTFVADAGATPRYLDSDGRHNLRQYARMAANVEDDFMSGGTASTTIGERKWYLANGTVTRRPATAGHPGIIRLSTGVVAGTLATLSLLTDPANGAMVASDTFDLEYVLALVTNDTDTLIRVGLAQNHTQNPPNDGIYFEKTAASTTWMGVCRLGGANTQTSPLSAADTSMHRFHIRRVNSTTIGFTIGARANGNSDARLTANIPTVSLTPFLQVRNVTGVDKSLDLDWFQLNFGMLQRWA